MDKILVLDFGGQYNQLIARRVRNLNVYAEIKSFDRISPTEIKEANYKGIIFTGGPNSVYDPNSPHYSNDILKLNIPVLGICYGDQLLAYMNNGVIVSAKNNSEYGKTELINKGGKLFKDVPEKSVCWMSHTDYIKDVPEGFVITAVTKSCPCAAMENVNKNFYGVQFHPEVTHTEYGMKILSNFIFEVC